MKKKRIDTNLFINTSPKIKISELISEYASDYINMGDNTEERQSLLNGACSAWNIAVLPEQLREEALRHNIEDYRRLNPGIDDADDLIHDMRTLIKKKLERFPDVKKVIVGAFIEPVSDTRFRINIVSTNNPKQLQQILNEGSSRRKNRRG